jgi:hypothetical protein
MRPLGAAVIRSGLVDKDTLCEMQRWGLPIDVSDDESKDAIDDLDVIANRIQDALESAEQVRMQDTDLDIVRRWIDPENQLEGRLIVKDGDQKSTSKVIFCWTVMGEIAIPWKSDSIADFLTNDESHLVHTTKKDGKEVKKKYFFADVREFYIGDTKAFIVCSVKELP